MNRSTIVVGAAAGLVVLLFVVMLWPREQPRAVPPPAAPLTDDRARVRPVEPVVAPSPPTSTAPAAPQSPRWWQAESRDLFATYRTMQASNAGTDLIVARSILLDCYGWTRKGSLLRRVAAGGAATSETPAPKPAQVDAATDVLARCHGFDGMTRLEQQQAWADTGGRLGRADDAAGWADAVVHGRRHVSDDLLRAILASQDPVAIAGIVEPLADRYRKSHGLTGDRADGEASTQRMMEESVFATLIACDLGDSCGPGSFVMRVACAFHAEQCGLDRRTIVLDEVGVPAENRLMIFEQVDAIVGAIRARDFTIWGL